MTQLDQTLFLALNSGSDVWGLPAFLAWFLAKLVIFAVPLHLATIWVFGDRSVRRQALAAFAALLLAIAASALIGWLLPTERPFMVPLGHVLIEHRGSASFPSNHGLVMFTYAAAWLLLGHRRHAIGFGLAGLLVAWSRIYLGVHYPFDMLGAAVLALAAAWAATRGDRHYGARLSAALDRAYGQWVETPVLMARARLRR